MRREGYPFQVFISDVIFRVFKMLLIQLRILINNVKQIIIDSPWYQ